LEVVMRAYQYGLAAAFLLATVVSACENLATADTVPPQRADDRRCDPPAALVVTTHRLAHRLDAAQN
jgi:hypothetical protein